MLSSTDHRSSRRAPYVNSALIGANLLVFGYELSLGPDLEPFLQRWGAIPSDLAAFFSGADPAPAVLVTLLTSTFLHAGWVHLGGNLLYLWIFGERVEDALGHGRYLAFYLLAGLVASLAQVASDPAAMLPAIGASGAIAAVLAAYIVLYPNATVAALLPAFRFVSALDVPTLLLLALWFGAQLLSGVATLSEQTQTTGLLAWWAHAGGFVAGLILVNLFRPRKGVPSYRYL